MNVGWLLVGIAVISDTIACYFMDKAQGFTQLLPSIVTLLCTACSIFCVTQAAQYLEIGLIYSVWSGLAILLITTMGILFLGESVTLSKILFTGLIIIGTVGLYIMPNKA